METDPKLLRWWWLFNALNKRYTKPLVPDVVYYWLLDRLTNNNGWRPLSIREAKR